MKCNVTMEKTIRFSFDIEVEPEESIDDIDGIIGDYEERVRGAGGFYNEEYSYAVCDEDGNTIVDWT